MTEWAKGWAEWFKHLLQNWGRKLPTVLQTETAECGLACLTMVARFHGHDIDLPSLRRKHPTSLRGSTLAEIMTIAAELGFTARAIRLELDGLPYLDTPCILHWDLNHFVVLESATARDVVIHDPARGVRRLVYPELSEHFTGVALELSPGDDFSTISARESISLRALAGRTRGLRGALAQILALALALEIFALIGPLYLQWVLDKVLVTLDRHLLTLLGIGFLLLTIFQAAISAIRSWSITWLGAMLDVQWITRVFAHLLKLPMAWYEKRDVGDVVSRFSSVETIEKTLTTDFIAAILDGLMASLTLILLGAYSLKLTLLVAVAFGIYATLRWFTYRPLWRAQENQIVYAARQQTQLLEAIRGAQTLKLHNQQQPRTSRYANAVVDTVNRDIAVQRLDIAVATGNQLIFGIGRVVLVWAAAVMVLDGTFTAGMLVAFAAYAQQFVTRASGLIDKGIEFRMLRLHAQRVADIALAEPERDLQPASASAMPLPEARIEVRNVSFRYTENEPWILRNCSFVVQAGEFVALTGPAGCGKTTLAKIVLGLLEPQEGQVLYGGVDIRRLGLARYRNHVGSVMQDDQLFAGSIADNIACFDTDSTPLQIENSARLAAIHEDIVAMPMGYQTLIGDMGSTLSGGQKQLVLLARALHKKPTLLLLDEATSHMDLDREKRVNEAINRLRITRLVIAHRQGTIKSAQRVLSLDTITQPVPGTVGHANQPRSAHSYADAQGRT